ncbi:MULTISPECIES: pyridoxal phosphate-dependent aminotransferase [Cupriavidus]|uniref:Aminotransferase n=2 Tax=Cupriavidus TaxID=106589 RepID=A0A7W4YSH9_9BURK|nr:MULTISPECIES: pyridoxal phosphate-dependent aminotransferase [Cupriavidus]MBB3009840.1 aspartate aminotransferase/aminotransferase [Cupriavidus alkaliphilus]QBY56283.1 pyridoxal phosphate-dependent aminotransferase [Cupriavidus oxalaticus]
MTASRIETLTRSGIRRVMQLSAAAEARGEKVIHLEVGQPDFPTPAHIQDAAAKAVKEGKTGYTACAGIPELRVAVAERVSSRTGRKVSSNEVLITSGAVNAIYLALSSILESGDEVLVPDPAWPNYHSGVSLAEGKSIRYPLLAHEKYEPDFEALERLVTPRTRVIFVNTPGNPTGVSWSRKTMTSMAEFAERHGLYILSDEVYEDMVYEGRHVSMLEIAPIHRVLLVSGTSKSYAMTGWRIGWLIADAEIINAAAAFVEPTTSCAASPSQYAALEAVNGPQDSVDDMRRIYHDRMMRVQDRLQDAGILLAAPTGGMFAMLDISATEMTSDVFVERLLAEKGVAAAPGSTFGPSSERSIRISFATAIEDLQQGVDAIIDFVKDNSRK